MKCFYHNDMDGKCAAFWVVYAAARDKYNNCQVIPIDYRDKFPLDTIEPGEHVYIVDFSIQPDEMRELLKITNNVTWIDHHKTAIEKYADFEHEIRGVRYDGIAGCELTWIYLHRLTDCGTGPIKEFDPTYRVEVPIATRLIGDRDVWQWKFGNETKMFYAGLQLRNTTPYSPVWMEVLCDIKHVIQDGIIVEEYKKQQREYLIKNYAFEVVFEGYKAIACNSKDSSELFGELIKSYDFVITFIFDGNQYVVSLFSEKVDVSQIAKKYGGGGHKKAAGFQCKELPL